MSKYHEWEKRQDGFKYYLTQVTDSLSDDELKKLPRATPEDLKNLKDLEHLKDLTEALKEFEIALFTFFLDGFSDFLGDGNKKIKLITSAEFPPEYVLQKILQQASFDLTVIQRLIEQRKDAKLSNLLQKYDQIALAALSIAFPDLNNPKNGLTYPVKPLTFFQGAETYSDIIPYGNIVLLGVPFSTEHLASDLLSIPHEIGHQVYETGWFSTTEPINLYFEKYFADQPAWIQNWLEEIFADLYGFLVAGPITGYSLQEILLDNFPSSLREDDGSHPVGIIRPLLFSELFKSPEFNNGDFEASKVAAELARTWDVAGKRRGYAKEISSNTKGEAIDFTKAKQDLGAVITEMYNEMNTHTNNAFDFPASLTSNKNLKPWTFFPGNLPSNFRDVQINPKDPFANFDISKVIAWQADKITKMQNILNGSTFKISRKEQNNFWLQNQIKYWEDKADITDPPLPALLPDIWKLIFTAFNWADKPSDDTRPVHGPETISREYIR